MLAFFTPVRPNHGRSAHAWNVRTAPSLPVTPTPPGDTSVRLIIYAARASVVSMSETRSSHGGRTEERPNGATRAEVTP